MSTVEAAIARTMDKEGFLASRQFSSSEMTKKFKIFRCEKPSRKSVVKDDPQVSTRKRIARLVAILEKAGIVEVAGGGVGRKKVKYVFASGVTDLMKP